MPIILVGIGFVAFVAASFFPYPKDKAERAAKAAFTDYLREDRGLRPGPVTVTGMLADSKLARADKFHGLSLEYRYKLTSPLEPKGQASAWVTVRLRNGRDLATVVPESVAIQGTETMERSMKMSSTNSAKSPPSNR
ncbi:hypothetical protein EON79_21830 [bacterium]|nr:MAG: hypothetical protein EON79_21830 [bacterium]